MDDRVAKYLFDVKIAIEEIDSYFSSKTLDFQVFKENLMLKRAVERNLEIIGEAVNRLCKVDDNFYNHITGAKLIIGLRNHVIHAYDNVSDEILLSVIIKHLPVLKNEINQLLNEATEQ